MVCVYCSSATKVTNSRHQKSVNQIWRRRKCLNCLAVFTTLEGVDATQALTFKKARLYEPFSRDKLLISIYDSLRHRKNAESEATALTSTVLSQLYPHVENATADRDRLALITGAILEKFDPVAATHYRAFHPVS